MYETNALVNPESNALALEYQGIYGSASRNLEVTYLVNNPAANGKCRVFGLGFSEQPFNLVFSELGSFFQNCPDPVLIAQDRI